VFNKPVEEDKRMYTSIVLVALAGVVAEPGSGSESPSWNSDYTGAARQGQRAHRPLAVFIGRGAKGWDQLSEDGRLNHETRKLLATRYVCVYLDTDRKEGRRLASLFQLGDGPGLVLSDHSGKYQAFRHPGRLSGRDLEANLRTYADPGRTARRTETQGRQEVQSYYYTPTQWAAPAAAPFQGFGGFGGYGGGYGGFSGGGGGC
jgi:hypothetical protein